MKTKTVCLDFDGVVHRYSEGWKDGTCYDVPMDGVGAAIKTLQDEGIAVCVHSTRSPKQIWDWFAKHLPLIDCEVVLDVGEESRFWNRTDCVGLFTRKPVATVYVDDRACRFFPSHGWEANFAHLVAQLNGDLVSRFKENNPNSLLHLCSIGEDD